MLKSELGKYMGQLTPETLGKLLAQVGRNLGFRPASLGNAPPDAALKRTGA